jgi:hypothetical protein
MAKNSATNAKALATDGLRKRMLIPLFRLLILARAAYRTAVWTLGTTRLDFSAPNPHPSLP